ncbi:MAG TPA: NIPSNAP family containing protein [Parafilimonas sp.]|nr:NIPSNAP family containing protein [Parafilimonas sp.]
MRKFLVIILFIPAIGFAKTQTEYYTITAYHFKEAQQEVALDTYLQTAYLPALHRKGKTAVGVFKPIANDTATDKLIYIIIPFKSLDEMQALQNALMQDATYMLAGKDYINASYQSPPYSRMETIVLEAFELSPQMNLPKLSSNKQDHIYELRSYESPTESYYHNKVKMFNAGGEIGIFSRLNFNAVFYGNVIAGCRMPNLMYMTSFENMTERDAHWKSFTDDPATKKLFAMDEYKNNVSKADIILMHAASYSDY